VVVVVGGGRGGEGEQQVHGFHCRGSAQPRRSGGRGWG
jgi:hypothetical protein